MGDIVVAASMLAGIFALWLTGCWLLFDCVRYELCSTHGDKVFGIFMGGILLCLVALGVGGLMRLLGL